ncbi:ABC transporter substrate-binding protein [Dehalobacter restrictus]|jgi:iron complex transport system substrate-binding protein|uniref:ABC transporter substrate-binding protein n=1 Tax=Dehalobacter restrictus TaxID=55583 RepID=UPI00338FFB09
MRKSTISILIIMLAVCILAAGCGPGPGPSASTTPKTRTITDSVGRTVEIPATVEKIVPLGNTPRMITYLGLANKVVGLGGMAADKITPVTAYAYANKDLWANVPIVGTDAAGATDYYPEQIISVKPDVILCSYTKELADEIQTKTGIPVVAVPMGTLFGKDYEDALRLLGDVCGAKERAEEVISYINNSLKDLATRTSNIPDANKPTVLGAAATFKGAHGIEGVYMKYAVFSTIAANDVTKGVSDKAGGVLVDKEQIIGWNPQFIFLDSGGVNLVKTDYTNNPDFYAHLKAVNEGNIYQYPSSTSYYSNVEIPIVNSYYVASLLYPEQFKDIVFKDKANEIFKFFLGTDDYLSKLENAGAGYDKVTLGDK